MWEIHKNLKDSRLTTLFPRYIMEIYILPIIMPFFYQKGKKMSRTEKLIKLENPCPWSGGAPCPFIAANGRNVALFYVMQGSLYENVQLPDNRVTDDMTDNHALVTFQHAYAYKTEGINDEVFFAHPLLKQMLGYEIFLVKNSAWIKEQQKIHSKHLYYSKKEWKTLKHYLFVFHDEIFHCIAESFTVVSYRKSYKEMKQILLKSLN